MSYIKPLTIILFFIFSKNLFAAENFYNFEYSKNDLKNISKNWVYNSGILKDTQNKIIQFNDKLIHLDGYKNLLILSLIDGKEVCKNIGQKDRAPYRGLSLYTKQDETYAIFIRQGVLKLVNVNNCKELILENEIKALNTTAPVLVHNSMAIILPNGDKPKAYSLNSGKLIWEVSIEKKKIDALNKINLNKKFSWDVWGGGTLDTKYNQIIFSTANAKPSFTSKGREGPNLFYNSIVSINLKNGSYNWHFQEIEHDVLNLDLASRPALFNHIDGDLVIQASKAGQLIILDRMDGKHLNNYEEKTFFHDDKKKIFTKIRQFDDWLRFSKINFKADDINELNEKYKKEAKKIIKKSSIAEYKALSKDMHYIHYGMHGGSEWPGIAVDDRGQVIIPASNIAWMSKLKDPADFDFFFHSKKIFLSSLKLITFDFNKFKNNAKIIINSFNKIINFNKPGIELYKKFESADGIPLNSPPWGTITLIDIKEKKIKWQVPHGNYPQLDIKHKNKGSEVFGCPAFIGKEVFFIAGTRDKKIYAYDVKNGNILWKDDLPYIAYGCPIIAEFNQSVYLIIDASGGRKFRKEKMGDAIISYKLK